MVPNFQPLATLLLFTKSCHQLEIARFAIVNERYPVPKILETVTVQIHGLLRIRPLLLKLALRGHRLSLIQIHVPPIGLISELWDVLGRCG